MSEDRIFRLLYGKCLRFLGLRLRSEQEMRTKLREWVAGLEYVAENGVSADWSEVIERVIAQLKKEKFVDDERFAREWIRSRLRAGKRGPGVIRMELSTKGVSREVMERVFAEMGQSEDDISELDGAKTAADRYLRRIAGKPTKEQRMKLYTHLAGKRFSSSVIRAVISEKLDA